MKQDTSESAAQADVAAADTGQPAATRAITGTRWSGPAFFGLKQKRSAA